MKSNDKRRGRLNAMRFVLNRLDYEGKLVGDVDPLIVGPAPETFD